MTPPAETERSESFTVSSESAITEPPSVAENEPTSKRFKEASVRSAPSATNLDSGASTSIGKSRSTAVSMVDHPAACNAGNDMVPVPLLIHCTPAMFCSAGKSSVAPPVA